MTSGSAAATTTIEDNPLISPNHPVVSEFTLTSLNTMANYDDLSNTTNSVMYSAAPMCTCQPSFCLSTASGTSSDLPSVKSQRLSAR